MYPGASRTGFNARVRGGALEHHPTLAHTFIYGNKMRQDIIFRRQLDALAAEHPERLTLVHALSREPSAERHGPEYH